MESNLLNCVRETDWQRETKTDCYTDPWLLLLTIYCVIFKAPLSTSSASRPGSGYSIGGPLWAVLRDVISVGHPAIYWHSHDRLNLFWPQAEPVSRLTPPVSHMNIYIYHFITPTHFRSTTWLLPLIFTGASCAENLWLTAWLRVNMQHLQQLFR